MTLLTLLEQYYPASPSIKGLFVNSLGVRDADQNHILSELRNRKANARWRELVLDADLQNATELFTEVYEGLDKYWSESAVQNLRRISCFSFLSAQSVLGTPLS